MGEVVALLSRCSTITCTLVGTIAIVHKSQLFTNVTIATNTNHSGGGAAPPQPTTKGGAHRAPPRAVCLRSAEGFSLSLSYWQKPEAQP